MSTEKNKAVVRRFAEEFKNKGNLDIVDELFTDDFVHHFNDPRLPKGREGTKLIGRAIFAAFPDVHATIEIMLAEGDWVAERTTARATHNGEFNGIPATGKQVVWTENHIYRFANGKITEHWPELDLLGLMIQLGAIPAPGQSGS
jgi:predicted ester cyclase